MKGFKVLFGMFMLLLLMSASSVVSQEKASPAQAHYAYDEGNQQTVRGWVVETRDFQCPVNNAMGSHITIKNETGSIEVHLAPASFMKQYDIAFTKDQNVTVVGSKITYEGKPALIAKSVIIGRETFNFRDAKGRPLW